MEKKARPRSDKTGGRKKPRRRGSKNDKLAIDERKILKPDNLPEGSKFKGYEDFLVQDLILRPWTVLYRRQRWKTPDGGTIVAELPDSISGHFGSGLIRFVLSQYHKCRVTLPLIIGQLHDFGISISGRHVMRLLIKDKQPFLVYACVHAHPVLLPVQSAQSDDRLLKRLHGRKDELLMVLERPDIPLHTNGSQNDIRCQVTKRKISGGTRSNQGRDCRDAFLSLMKTCAKLEISFWDYLGDRRSHPGVGEIPPLPNLIRQQATA